MPGPGCHLDPLSEVRGGRSVQHEWTNSYSMLSQVGLGHHHFMQMLVAPGAGWGAMSPQPPSILTWTAGPIFPAPCAAGELGT